MEYKHISKESLQQKAVERILKMRNMVLQWPTGLGKSKAAIDIINCIEALTPVRYKVLLVVAEIAHKNNWIEEFHKFNTVVPDSVVIETYASLKNHKGEKYSLIVLDEGHHVGSDLRLDILSTIVADYVLVLSATFPDEILYSLESIYGIFDRYRISLQEVIDWGILPKPDIYLIPMELDDKNYNQIIKEEWGSKKKREFFKVLYPDRWDYLSHKKKYPNVTLEISCTELQKYVYITSKMEFWRDHYFRTRSEMSKNKWLQMGSARKRYLGELKTSKARELLSLVESKRFVCFCASIEQAEELGGNNSIHSKKSGALNTIEDFNSKKINSLFAVGMIQEGQNLVDIDVGIIVQLDGKERAFIQKTGRALRAKEPSIFILYYKGSRDEEYLENALENINSEYVFKVLDLNEIKL